MQVLVTGASGVFGRAVMEELLARGHGVVGFSRSVPAPLPVGVRHVAGDITDHAAVGRAMEGCDTVAHCAWMVDTATDRASEEAVNVGGTQNLLRAMSSTTARRIVFASSVTGYGPQPPGAPPCREEQPLRPAPGHTYAEDKVRVEGLLAAADVETVVIRVAIVMGRRIDNRILAGFASPVLPAPRGQPSSLQFVHADDVGRFFARACEAGPTGTVNLAAPGVLDWAEVGRLLGRPVLPVSAAALRRLVRFAWDRGWSDVNPPELEFTLGMPVADTTRLARTWGYECAFTGAEAVADTRLAVCGRYVLGKRTVAFGWRRRRPAFLAGELRRVAALGGEPAALDDDRLTSVGNLARDLARLLPHDTGAARLSGRLEAERSRRLAV